MPRKIQSALGPLPDDFFVLHSEDGRASRPALHKGKLLKQLAQAHDVWLNAKGDQEGLKLRRYARQLAIGAFLDWSYAEGDIPIQHLGLLVGLVMDLGDLHVGKQPELLKPAPELNRGNPGKSAKHLASLATACASIDALAGDRAQKITEIEQEVAQWAGLEVSRLRSWRKRFKVDRAKGKDSQAVAFYEDTMDLLQGLSHQEVRGKLEKLWSRL